MTLLYHISDTNVLQKMFFILQKEKEYDILIAR